MANRYAVASGSWSNPAIWDGGTLPNTIDVVRPNGFTVTIDQDVTVSQLRDNAVSPAVAGGNFLITTGITLNASLIQSDQIVSLVSSGNLLTINNTGICTINANFQGCVSTATQGSSVNTERPSNFLIIGQSNGSVIINGSISSSTNAGFTGIIYKSCFRAQNGSNYTITINGNINPTSSMVNSSMNISTFAIFAGYTVNINGTVLGGTATVSDKFNACVEFVSTGSVLNITGLFQGGTVSSQLNNAIFGFNPSNTVNVDATCNAVNSNSAIRNVSVLLGNCLIQDNSSVMAIVATRYNLQPNKQAVWNMNDSTNFRPMYSTLALPSLPTASNVRSGISYASGALTGTLVVPPASAVTKDVVFDNGTLGTAENTAATFLAALSASTDPLAERLRNVATVQTTGDQIAAAL